MSVTEQRVATKAEMLHRGADLVEEFGWCQHASARNEHGVAVDPFDSTALSFCLTGAVERAIFDLFDGWIVRFDGFPPGLKGRCVYPPVGPGNTPYCPHWNNAPERTKADVVSRLRSLAEASA